MAMVMLGLYARKAENCATQGGPTFGNRLLVGREEQIELLLRRWQQATNSEGCVVLLSGEPGIGKSRLTRVLQEQLSAQPHFRLLYCCLPHYQDSTLYPIIIQIQRAAG